MKKICSMFSLCMTVISCQAMEGPLQHTTYKTLKTMPLPDSQSTELGKWTCAARFLDLTTLRAARQLNGLPTEEIDSAVKKLRSHCPSETPHNAAQLVTQQDLRKLQVCQENKMGRCTPKNTVNSKYACSKESRLSCLMQQCRIMVANAVSQS